MLDRAKQLRILVESSRRSLDQISSALDELEAGLGQRTNYSSLQRGFHMIKHDALHLQLKRLARLAGASEAIVGGAGDRKLGLPLDLLRSAAQEIREATETLAAGGRHRLNDQLLSRLEAAAAIQRVD